MTRALWGAVAVMGALYWASKQPGGIPGTWGRLRAAVDEVKHGGDPMEAGRRFIRGEATRTINDPALQPGDAIYD